MGETLTIPVAALCLQPRQQLFAQPGGDIDLAHGLAETFIELTFTAGLAVAVRTVVEVAFQCCGLFRFQFVRCGAKSSNSRAVLQSIGRPPKIAAVGQNCGSRLDQPSRRKALALRQTRHHRSHWQIHLFGNVSITKILEIVQNNRRPERFRQFVEGLLQPLRVDVRRLRRQRLGQIADMLQGNTCCCFSARAMQVGIAQNAEQPRLGPRGIAELAEVQLRLARTLLAFRSSASADVPERR